MVGGAPARGGIAPRCAAAAATADAAGNAVNEGHPTERAVSHAMSSGGFAGRRSGANPSVFIACAKFVSTYSLCFACFKTDGTLALLYTRRQRLPAAWVEQHRRINTPHVNLILP